MRDTLKRRVRKSVKWGGAVLTVLLVVVWIGSYTPRLSWRNASDGGVSLSWGRLILHDPVLPAQWTLYRDLWYEPRLSGWPWWFEKNASLSGSYLAFPLWPLPLLSLLATAAAWRADAKYLRRARERACPACGYDRAGLAAGSLCPECGAAAGA